jgi:hypothetical protein
MKSVLNRGLNFCVTPLTLNITNVLVDYRKYERSIKWTKFFASQDNDTDSDSESSWKKDIFPKEKLNIPPNSSSAVKIFLSGVKSEIIGSTRNITKSNISKAEREALESLVKPQCNCVIVIKPCDKGAGIIICDYTKYVNSCKKKSESKTKDGNNYYKPVTQLDLTKAKHDIDETLKKALNLQHITQLEHDAMTANEKTPGKFYQLFKVHKKFEEPDQPPGRLIISGCGSITENLSLFVDHHTKDLVPLIPSYLQDTPHLLREIENLKTTGLPQGAFPVSIDVVGLYTNIPHNEGIESVERALNTRRNPEVPTNTLIEFLNLVLKYNIFEFKSDLYQQKMGTAMGTCVAPTMANIFMSEIDTKIQNCAKRENLDFIHYYKRYIDDIF